MSANRRRASRERVAKSSLDAKKHINSQAESWGTRDWLEDLEDYRSLIHRILNEKGVGYGSF